MKKYAVWVALGLYSLMSILMYPHFWRQLWSDDSVSNAVHGEVVAASWGMEQLYQNILDGKNPFDYRLGQLYPFGNSLLSTDSGNGFFFLFTRPWLSINQSLSLIVIMSVIISCLGMYLLLTALGVRRGIAFWLGAAFGFTTILQPRMGHLTYMSIYVFPLFFYAVIKSKPIMTALFLILSLYLNLYYFVILIMMSVWMLIHYLWTRRGQIASELYQYRRKILVFGVSCFTLLLPWLVVFGKVRRFEGLPQTEGWGGAIDFSADLLGIFIPSTYSRFLYGTAEQIGAKLPFAWGIFEQHIYPGIIILLGLLLIAWQWKKLARQLKLQLLPWILGAIGFWILTLGPFLHILGKWRINLDGVPFVIPMPYALFHYLPFMENIRSPGRLAIGMVFFAYVAIGLLIEKSKWRYWGVIGLLSLIFVLDHPFKYTPAVSRHIPTRIYQTIESDREFFSIYEMPSAVRDGFKYFGNLASLDFIPGQLIHDKPIIAGYFGRVPDFKREYIASNPFFGYMGRLMDPGVENNGAIDRTELSKWRSLDLIQSQKAIDFVGLKYVILQNDAIYSASAAAALAQLDFQQVMTENNFSLWQRKLINKEFINVMVGQSGDDMYLGVGWRGRDNNFRYMGKTGSIMFRLNQSRPMKLLVTGAAYHKPQRAKVYLNQKLVGEIDLGIETEKHVLDIGSVPSGLVTVHIIFPRAYLLDETMLSAKIMIVALEELND